MKARALAGLALTAVLVCGANATVRNVPEDYASVQAGIDAAVNGDTVLVAPGLYFETINFNGKNITVTSTDPNDSGIVGYTIINGQKKGSVVTFKGYENSKAVLTGFTITNGSGTITDTYSYSSSTLAYTETYIYGGNIYCAGASPTITHNVITNSVLPYVNSYTTTGSLTTYVWTDSYGGGIYSYGSPTIMYNTICRNTAEIGGGIYCSGSATIADNLIYDNSGYEGGGVFAYSNIHLLNNTIASNDTSLNTSTTSNYYGGNLYLSLGNDLSSCVIANNVICSADSGGGVFWYGSAKLEKVFRYNNVWGNAPFDYGYEDQRTYDLVTDANTALTGRSGNISADPVWQGNWGKKYRLDAGSPCISAGDPNFVPLVGEKDLDGDDRVYAVRVDMGADEYVGYVKPVANAGTDQHVLTTQPITLNGTGSYVSDPSTGVTYHWTQVSGPSVKLDDPNAAKPTFTPPGPGSYVFQLVVEDSQYAGIPDQMLVVVGNTPPVANAGPDRLWQLPASVTLDGSRSYDADLPDKLTYTWTQVGGPSVSLSNSHSAKPYFTSTQPNVYEFQLVVNDGFMDSAPARVKIETAPFTVSTQAQVVANGLSGTSPGMYFYASTDGTATVCAGSNTSSSSPSGWSIYRIDPKTKEALKYDAGAIDTKPKADGDITVWVGGTGSYSSPVCTSLCAASVMTGTTVKWLQTATSNTSYGYPAISGKTIVYLRHTNVSTTDTAKYANSSYDICGMDISDFAHPVSFTIATQAGHGQPYPYDDYYYSYNPDYVDVSGNVVVWEKDGDIYGADISDRNHIKIFPICTAPERQSDPAVSGHFVVWTDERNDMGDIYGADISDPNHVREFEVYVGSGCQWQPDIDGPLVAYMDGSSEYSNTVSACCLTKEYGATPISLIYNQGSYYTYSYGIAPSVHGSVIAWRDSNYGVSTARLDLAYVSAHGLIQNVTTGAHYDYIQHAITGASNGDVIVVPPGTYDERIRFGGKNVTVRSVDPQDPSIRSATIIKGDGQLVTFADGETADCLFTGFTVTGGSFGVNCDGGSPTITLCNITGNRDAGLKLWAFAKPAVNRCEITGNGIGVEMAMEIAVRQAGLAAPDLRNCVIAGNRTYGVYGADPVITNCTIADNGSQGMWSAHPKLSNSIVYFNNANGENAAGKYTLTVSYSDIQGGASGVGNIDLDPCFAQRGAWMVQSGLPTTTPDIVWVGGDYHLASQGWQWSPILRTWVWDDHRTSPCIDAGDPAASIGDEKACGPDDPLSSRARPNTRIDMGAYGGTAEASLAPKVGL